jgi:phosphatidylserine decarboxylase
MAASLSRWMRIAPESWAFILPLAIGSVLLSVLGWPVLAGVGIILIVGVAFFFRDPERTIPQAPGAIVSPADGRVMEIVAEGERGCRLSIFLSVLNVHINRAPYSGKVQDVAYTPGKFLAAYRREASMVNESNRVIIENEGREFVVRQIAGVLARRIVCRVQPGDVLSKGQRFGLIRFGSRTDVLIPCEAQVAVQVGDTVKGGESILAFLKEPQGV